MASYVSSESSVEGSGVLGTENMTDVMTPLCEVPEVRGMVCDVAPLKPSKISRTLFRAINGNNYLYPSSVSELAKNIELGTLIRNIMCSHDLLPCAENAQPDYIAHFFSDFNSSDPIWEPLNRLCRESNMLGQISIKGIVANAVHSDNVMLVPYELANATCRHQSFKRQQFLSRLKALRTLQQTTCAFLDSLPRWNPTAKTPMVAIPNASVAPAGVTMLRKCLPGLVGFDYLTQHLFSHCISSAHYIPASHADVNDHLTTFFTAYNQFFADYHLDDGFRLYAQCSKMLVFTQFTTDTYAWSGTIQRAFHTWYKLRQHGLALTDDAFAMLNAFVGNPLDADLNLFQAQFARFHVAANELP